MIVSPCYCILSGTEACLQCVNNTSINWTHSYTEEHIILELPKVDPKQWFYQNYTPLQELGGLTLRQYKIKQLNKK